MNLRFDINVVRSEKDHDIRSLIMEEASDIAERLTELECDKFDIIVWEGNDEDGWKFTEKAQDIFNIYYDKLVEDLYTLLNRQLRII